jgi:hypothetical protein
MTLATRVRCPAASRSAGFERCRRAWCIAAITVAALLASSRTVTPRADEFVRLSPGRTIAPADIAAFDAAWTQPAKHDAALNQSYWFLYHRFDAGAWWAGEHMAALARMYDVTREPRYLALLRAFIEQALTLRDDQHPGDIHNTGDDLPPRPVDQFRGQTVPGWGGKSLNSAGFHRADEVVSSLYAYPIAAFARIVTENPALQPTYGNDAVRYANAVIQTVWLFMPQVKYRTVGDFIEARLTGLDAFKTKPTAEQCESAYAEALERNPTADEKAKRRYRQMRKNCKELRLMAGHPHAHNENLAFAMVLIELSRALDSAFYQQSPARSNDAEPTRKLIPLLVARQQRFFANHLRTATDAQQRARFVWNYSDDVPSGISTHVEDTSHGAVDMRYLGVLHHNFERLNAVTAPVGEPIALDRSYFRRFANTFLLKIVKGQNFSSNISGAAIKAPGAPDDLNGTCDGWVNLSLADPAVYKVCRAVSLRVVNGRQPYLTIGNHSALLATKANGPADVPSCPAGRKCCEPADGGGCRVCVPKNAQCP